MGHSEELVGREIDGFRIESVLGKGGMGVVYRATELALHRPVAFKVLPESLASDSDFIARFYREARAAAKLNHPNVVTIHRVGFDQGVYYIAMELIDGHDLKYLVKDQPHISIGDVLSYSRQVAEALSFAHRRGVLHRDIKPQNIMVDKDGRIKVMDFGIAKLFTTESEEEPPDDAYVTQVGSFIGTPTHMPPERWHGKDANVSTDIYALGVVMYELATGKPPFTGRTSGEIASKVLYEEVPSVADLRGDVPDAVASIIERAMNREPELRPESADALIEEIDKVLAEDAINTVVNTAPQALPPTQPVAAAPLVAISNPSKLPLLVLGSVTLLLLAGLTWWVLDLRDKKAEEAFRVGVAVPSSPPEPLPPVAKPDPAPAVVENKPEVPEPVVSNAPPPSVVQAVVTNKPASIPAPVPEPSIVPPPPPPPPPANRMPVAEFSLPAEPIPAGQPLSVAFAVSDPDDDPLILAYRLDDQEAWIKLAEPRITLEHLEPGAHELHLDVRDGNDGRVVLSRSFSVLPAPPPPPVPAPTPPAMVKVPEPEPEPLLVPEPERPKLLHVHEGHVRNIVATAIAPDGRTFASADMDGVVRIWDGNGGLSGSWQAHSNSVRSLQFTTGPLHLVSAGEDQSIRIWEVGSGALLQRIQTDSERVILVETLSDGRLLSVDQAGRVQCWSAGGGRLVHSFEVGVLNAAVISQKGNWLLVAGEEPVLRLWDLNEGTLAAKMEGEVIRSTISLAISPDGKWAVSGGLDKAIVLWDLGVRKQVNSWEAHESWVQSLAFSYTGNEIISASKDATVKVWDRSSGKTLAQFDEPEKTVLCIAASPVDRVLIGGGVDKLLWTWRWPQ